MDRHRERGPAGFDRKYVATIDYVYQIPKFARGFLNTRAMRPVLNGWQVSGITRLWTGLPLTIKSSGNAGTLGGGPRADVLRASNPYPAEQTRNEWYIPMSFGRPFDGSLGTGAKEFCVGLGS